MSERFWKLLTTKIIVDMDQLDVQVSLYEKSMFIGTGHIETPAIQTKIPFDFKIPSYYDYNGKNYTVTKILPFAFYGLPIRSLTIPSTIESINSTAFGQCSLLETIVVDKDNRNYTSGLGNLYTNNLSVLLRLNNKCDTTTIDSSVETYGDSCFSGLKLESFTFSRKYSGLGVRVFEYCQELKAINTKYLKIPFIIPYKTFYMCTDLTSLNIVASAIDSMAFHGLGKDTLTIENVTKVCSRFLSYCLFNTIDLSKSKIKQLPGNALWNCILTDIILPPTLSDAESNAFSTSEITKIHVRNIKHFASRLSISKDVQIVVPEGYQSDFWGGMHISRDGKQLIKKKPIKNVRMLTGLHF